MALAAPSPPRRLASALRRLTLDPLLAALLPTTCPGCDGSLEEPSRGLLCGACLESLPCFGSAVCGCGAPFEGTGAAGDACGRCRRGLTPWTRGASLGPYEGRLRRAIHALKYDGRRRIATTLSSPLLSTQSVRSVLAGATALVAVPMHPRRQLERGFNQAEILATEISRRTGVRALASALIRFKDTPPQAGLTAFERRRNVASAFGATASQVVVGQTVVLVDDVITTGATATACARILRRAGALEVRLLTLARVP